MVRGARVPSESDTARSFRSGNPALSDRRGIEATPTAQHMHLAEDIEQPEPTHLSDDPGKQGEVGQLTSFPDYSQLVPDWTSVWPFRPQVMGIGRGARRPVG